MRLLGIVRVGGFWRGEWAVEGCEVVGSSGGRGLSRRISSSRYLAAILACWSVWRCELRTQGRVGWIRCDAAASPARQVDQLRCCW